MKQNISFPSLLAIMLYLCCSNVQAQEKYKFNDSSIKFFSSAPLEDITATNKDGKGMVDFTTQSFGVRIPIKSFEFERQLMEDHFNENYLESDKYPHCLFKGKIEGAYNLNRNGTYQVKAVGDLDLHGVTQQRSIPCQLVVKNGKYSIESKFQIKLADHKIEIPKLVFNKIAEIVEVTISSELVKL